MDIFKGYKPIAVRDNRWGLTVISYNPEIKKFLLVVDKKPAGPFTQTELTALFENIKDVLDLHGRFLYTEGYTADGERSDES